MLFLLCLSTVLLASSSIATDPETVSKNADDISNQDKLDSKDFWKLIFNTYYDLKGLRNETTDSIVESFFEHEFEAYPGELYPAFKKIFEHISKSNDRIWNLYESILYLYHNVEASDWVYETVLRRAALGKILKESGELDLDATFSFDVRSKTEYANLEHRHGVVIGEDEVVTDSYEQPCGNEGGVETLQVGSIRAIPGMHFPNYEDIPITSFTCAGKHIPGFYADLETGCQVFHVCYPHRRESFLCPIGTTFNQAILACDYWYSSNCSLAPLYFHSNRITDEHIEGTESFVDHLLGQYDAASTSTRQPADYPTKKPKKPKSPKIKIVLPNIDWSLMIKFLPVKSKIMECPDFCEKTSFSYQTESTTDAVPTTVEYTETTTMQPSTEPATSVPPKKEKYDEKTTKSEILLDILKAVEMLTKDAEGFLTEAVQKKHKQNVSSGIKPGIKLPKAKELAKPARAPELPTQKPKPLPEINQRFVVKPARKLPSPKVSRSRLLKPSKTVESKRRIYFRKKEPAKLILEGIKAISHLFE
ncbi:U-scoloptoxin(01)-Cw1a like protein [Argiope bruennichi]|uniref:U-scoloptoxin(01)-Cw1a like protein n=1 Tax=Argiope bruennichi TaxID=94029 RepID=A0A8T0E8W1_ARGBR|nr:U-scoloptoxin(01)-Cw1a like protein [Argiope bruennichi]